ncbi:sensor histidine kinase [Algivirga pacifica]|uniref:Signal transduction histidine kinase internal region domain-containing protein n=1 Tax=Algivirga pacifica TaxID=1162670 RepID=A0ABP9DB49_9BACT
MKDIINPRLLLIPFFWVVMSALPAGMMVWMGEKSADEVFNFVVHVTPKLLVHITLVVFVFGFLTKRLNKHVPWNSRGPLRIFLDTLMVVTFSVGMIVTLTPHLKVPAEMRFAMPFIVHTLVMVIIEMVLIYEDKKDLEVEVQKMEKEHIASKYNALKQQLDHHFLFNNLSVLSSLIYEDVDRADRFIQELSKIYRYVLNIKEKVLVPVKEELEFIDSYMFLLSIRFEEGLHYQQKVSEEVKEWYIPPLSLQLIVENAVKHNVVSKSQPLEICIRQESDCLVITNTYQLRKEPNMASNKTGQAHLTEKYELLSGELPTFYQEDGKYIVTLPLIKEPKY